MRVIVTAGPTRAYLDPVRFLTNASSGRMGFAVAAAAVRAGHQVTLLAGPVAIEPPGACEVVRFVTADDLRRELAARFADCDVLVMAAAVGDFTVERPAETKLRRRDGAVTVRLVPTTDLLAEVAARKTPGQTIVAFAVEPGPRDRAEAEARRKMAAKHADFVVLNPTAAIAAEASEACILSPGGVVLPWARRPKDALAEEIVRVLTPNSAPPKPPA